MKISPSVDVALPEQLAEADLTLADISEANLNGANLDGAVLDGANLAGSVLTKIKARGTRFLAVPLRDAC